MVQNLDLVGINILIAKSFIYGVISKGHRKT